MLQVDLTSSAVERATFFWTICIPVRSYLATRGDVLWLRAFAVVLATRWITGGAYSIENVFGGPAWWAAQRGVHGMLWLSYALSGDSLFLKVDTLLGIINWLRTHLVF